MPSPLRDHDQTTPLALSDEQLDQIMRCAAPLHPRLRRVFEHEPLYSNRDARNENLRASILDASLHERIDESFVHCPTERSWSDDHAVQHLRDVNVCEIRSRRALKRNFIDRLGNPIEDFSRWKNHRRWIALRGLQEASLGGTARKVPSNTLGATLADDAVQKYARSLGQPESF